MVILFLFNHGTSIPIQYNDTVILFEVWCYIMHNFENDCSKFGYFFWPVYVAIGTMLWILLYIE
jgi:hypothetical protein